MLDAPTPLPAPTGVRRALRGSQLNQGLTPSLSCTLSKGLMYMLEGPARRRATCGILVSIMSISSCPASRTGPPSLAGSTARLRINPTSSRAQRRDSYMLLGSRPNSLPQRLRVPFEHVMKAGLTAPVLPECAAARTIPSSIIIVSPRAVAICLFIHD